MQIAGLYTHTSWVWDRCLWKKERQQNYLILKQGSQVSLIHTEELKTAGIEMVYSNFSPQWNMSNHYHYMWDIFVKWWLLPWINVKKDMQAFLSVLKLLPFTLSFNWSFCITTIWHPQKKYSLNGLWSSEPITKATQNSIINTCNSLQI